MKLKMYESEVKAAMPKITKVTKDNQSYAKFLFSDWRILDYLKHSKDFCKSGKIIYSCGTL